MRGLWDDSILEVVSVMSPLHYKDGTSDKSYEIVVVRWERSDGGDAYFPVACWGRGEPDGCNTGQTGIIEGRGCRTRSQAMNVAEDQWLDKRDKGYEPHTGYVPPPVTVSSGHEPAPLLRRAILRFLVSNGKLTAGDHCGFNTVEATEALAWVASRSR